MNQVTIPDEIYTRILRFFESDEDLFIAASILGAKLAFPVLFFKISIAKKSYTKLFKKRNRKLYKVITKEGKVLISPSRSETICVIIDDFDRQNSKADSHQLCFLKPYITNVEWYVEGQIEGPETVILNSLPNLKSLYSNIQVNHAIVESLELYLSFPFEQELSQSGDNIQDLALTTPEADNEEQTGYIAINSRKFPRLRKLTAHDVTVVFTDIMPQLRVLNVNRAFKGLNKFPNLQELFISFETPYGEIPECLANLPDKLECLCLKNIKTSALTLSLEGISKLDHLYLEECSFGELRIVGDSFRSINLDDFKYKCLLINCPSLEKLELRRICAQTFGSELENCNQLKSLKIYGSEIETFQLPILESLKRLEIVEGGIGVMKGLNLPELEFIDISNCKIGSVEEFNCPSLRELTFIGVGLKAISFLRNCNNVETLDLTENDISDLSGISFPDKLKKLTLSSNTFKKLQNLSNLNNLIDLDIFDGAELSEIEKLSKNIPLETLCVNYTKINSLKPFEDLAKLRKLDAACCSLRSIERLNGLSELTTLNLEMNEITKIENLEPLCSLKVLSLSRNPITKLENLKPLKFLECLNLNHTEIQILDGDEIRGLDNLTSLSVMSSDVGEVINFHDLSLVTLNLENNRITHVGGIHDMFDLRDLSLGINSISGIDKEFRVIPKLEVLTLYENTLGDDFEFDADARGINKQVSVELQYEESIYTDYDESEPEYEY